MRVSTNAAEQVVTRVSRTERLLESLRGVARARVETDQSGRVVRVSIERTGEESERQILRNIRSATKAALGEALPERLITFPAGTPLHAAARPGCTVVPVKTRPAPAVPSDEKAQTPTLAPSSKFLLEEISTELRNGVLRCRLQVRCGGRVTHAEVEAFTTESARLEAGARAALETIRAFGIGLCSLENIRVADAGGSAAVIATVQMFSSSIATGSVPFARNAERAGAEAVLAAASSWCELNLKNWSPTESL